MMLDPFDDLPPHIRNPIRQLLDGVVTGGNLRFKTSKDRSGIDGQRAISKILKDNGIPNTDARWMAINQYGQDLYYGKSPAVPSPIDQPPQHRQPSSSSDGPAYSSGTTFRARAEAHQRRCRAELLNAGHGKWGHLLDERSTNAGLNFHHPAARLAAESRIQTGKGVDRTRTFGNMLSSQAMCFNIFGPLAHSPDGLELAGQLLSPFIHSLARVQSITIEYTPPFELFHDQAGLAGVDCDVLIECEHKNGERAILVIETKFVELSFSSCGHCSKNNCPPDVKLGTDYSGCRYASKNGFLYWQRSAEYKTIRLPLAADHGCPFRGHLWQIWVNHTLAHAEAARRGVSNAFFAVCAPRQNDALNPENVLAEFRQIASDPSSIVFIPLEDLLHRLVAVCQDQAEWREWANLLETRYVVPAQITPQIFQDKPRLRVAVTNNHRKLVEWMGTQTFRDIVAVHRTVCAERASIYFRPTDKGLVRIALHPRAASYIGFRSEAKDESYLIRIGSRVPTASEIEDRLTSFEKWMPFAGRPSKEEQGVIPWISKALENKLWLPELGEGWIFLHQEWRFNDERNGKKSDVLAVHGPTGQLGIIEFKSSESALEEARLQVADYSRFWEHDAPELAPFFTALLHAMCAAYGNDSEGATVSVRTGPAALFVGVASPSSGIRITKC